MENTPRNGETDIPDGVSPHLLIIPGDGGDHIGDLLVKLPISQGIRCGLSGVHRAAVSAIAGARRRHLVAAGLFGEIVGLVLAIVGKEAAHLGRV